MPILLIAAALLLVLGGIAMVAILLAARRCPSSANQMAKSSEKDTAPLDPWKEAGNRAKGDFDELE